ncbi:MAG: DnaJ domain-containing protein [Methylobacter tundripaludum]|uniref:Curved DNA-binding protein n=1 Tax=Methylobacter tundripaludum TaxID=173365 RepID=A0A2S6H2F2_9GAMM|nr:DnaJ C-terminal domain-containing protein [Methylobacter tundripaludum]MCK9637208.1 DnaJ domain-containing protein [Methylobacter tundripaludum]PPK71624.1 curved DNA-binding protein [Methylobacter tundripaludum]
MQYKDYYKVMWLPRNATQVEIKRAYRKLARKHHPDVSKEPDAEAKFKELGEAYEVLKDPQKRAAYDRLGSHWKAGEDFSPPPNWDEGFEFSSASADSETGAFSHFFEQLFGRSGLRSADRRQRGIHARGLDSRAKIYIDLEDSIQGATRNFSLSMPETDAQGFVQVRHRALNIKIPKGIKAGQHIRLTGQGERSPDDGKTGNLLLEVAFNAHPMYRVSETDIYLNLPVTPWEAKLGARIKVPTPNGSVELKIPPHSQQDSHLRLKGLGLPAKPPGDFYVMLKIVLPPANTEQAKAAYQKMQQEFDFNPRLSLGV